MRSPVAHDAVDLLPESGSCFVLRSGDSEVGRVRYRSPELEFGLGAVVRAMSRRWAGAAGFVVEDADGTTWFEIAKSAGKDGAFTMQVTDAHGRTIGSGEVGGLGLTRMFPEVSLVDAAGVPLGRLTTRPPQEVLDPAGRVVGRVLPGVTRVVMGAHFDRVGFAPAAGETLRVLVVSAVLCRSVG